MDESIDMLPLSKFNELCAYEGLTTEAAAIALAALDKLGIALHFPGEVTGEEVVLNPEWITRAIYFIIWSADQVEDSRLTPSFLLRLFKNGQAQHGLMISPRQCGFLLKLMERFQLAFKDLRSTGQDHYLVPMIAPVTGATQPPQNSLRTIFYFEFLPPALFYRYVTQVCSSQSGVVRLWRTGASVQVDSTEGWMLFEEHRRRITLSAVGEESANMLHNLRAPLFELLGEDGSIAFSEQEVPPSERRGPYSAISYTPVLFTPDQMEVNWFHVVAALSRHRDTVSTQRGGEVNIAAMAPYFESRQGESQNSLIEKLISEVSAIRSQSIHVNIHTTNHSTSQSAATVHSTINASLSLIHQQMPPIEDGLVRIVRALEDFRDLEIARVESNEVAAMSRELARMQEDIATLLSLRDDEVEAHARKSTTLERIKDGWGRLTSTAEVINESPKVVEAFQRVRVLMAEVGEWIQNLPGL